MITNQDKLIDAIEGIQLRTTHSNPSAGEIVVRISDVLTLFLKESKEREKEAYEKGKVDGFTEYSSMELKKYNREKQREHRQKLHDLEKEGTK